MTYSIVARDDAAGQVGAAVQSAWYLSAGVILVEAGVGAIVSQAMSERAFAHQGLDMIRAGSTPSDAIAALMAGDTMPAIRQLGAIDVSSPPAAFTGTSCVPHAGTSARVDCVAQANMMEHSGVPQAMVAAFEASGDLAARLLAALDAAQALGGDFRGMQSAGLVVRAGEQDTPVWSAAVVDVRVDDHPEPLRELRRLVELTRVYQEFNMTLARLAAGDHDGAWSMRLGGCPVRHLPTPTSRCGSAWHCLPRATPGKNDPGRARGEERRSGSSTRVDRSRATESTPGRSSVNSMSDGQSAASAAQACRAHLPT